MKKEKEQGPVYIITGEIDSGKSTELEKRIKRYEWEGYEVDGVCTEAQWNGGVKTGFDLLRLHGNERVRLAEQKMKNTEKSRSPVRSKAASRFRFYEEGFRRAAEWLSSAVEKGVDVICVDELGPVELEGGGHWPAVRDCALNFEGTLIVVVRSELKEAFYHKFVELGRKVEVIEVL